MASYQHQTLTYQNSLSPSPANHNFHNYHYFLPTTMCMTYGPLKCSPIEKRFLGEAIRHTKWRPTMKFFKSWRKSNGLGVVAGWIESNVPTRLRPYAYLMHLENASTTPWIPLFPCLWAIGLATEPGKLVHPKIMVLSVLLGFVTRGIGCTINDYLDRDIDAKVKRTKGRPLASGELAPWQALCFLLFEVVSCCVLLLKVNNLSRILWGSFMLLTFIYPLTKRVTFWSQAFCAFTVNFFSLCGWSAVKGSLDLHILIPLWTSGVLWELVFETIYGHQDKEDDVKIGAKSTALLFGTSTKTFISGFSAASIGGFLLTGFVANIGWPYYLSVAAAAIQLSWQIWSVDLDCPIDCFKKFESNVYFGAIIFSGILLGRLLQ